MYAKIRSYFLAVLFATALAGLAVGCSDDDKPSVEEDEIRLYLRTTPLPVESHQQFIYFSVDGEWTLSSSADWLLFCKAVTGSDFTGTQTLSGSDSQPIVVLSMANPEEKSRMATITIKAGNQTGTLEVSQKGTKTGEIRVGGDAALTAGWLELPETNAEDGFDAYTVRFDDDNRSYTFYYDYENLLSNWVAYPLNKSLIGSYVARSNAWAYCPLFASSKQQNVASGYKEGNNGWYARGHQLPSADRWGSYARNAQTYYGVNITPQNNDFNGALWATLEGKVREWASKTYTDTLYVVTGCVSKNAKYYVLDAGYKRVTVPTAYFKAVLLHEKADSKRFTEYGGYVGCAFWFDHEEYSQPGKYNASFNFDNMAMSIQELELKLGYKLYVNLADKVGSADLANKIKNRTPEAKQGW